MVAFLKQLIGLKQLMSLPSSVYWCRMQWRIQISPWADRRKRWAWWSMGRFHTWETLCPWTWWYTKFFTHICVYWPKSSPNPQFLRWFFYVIITQKWLCFQCHPPPVWRRKGVAKGIKLDTWYVLPHALASSTRTARVTSPGQMVLCFLFLSGNKGIPELCVKTGGKILDERCPQSTDHTGKHKGSKNSMLWIRCNVAILK